MAAGAVVGIPISVSGGVGHDAPLVGENFHGFRTMADLNLDNIIVEGREFTDEEILVVLMNGMMFEICQVVLDPEIGLKVLQRHSFRPHNYDRMAPYAQPPGPPPRRGTRKIRLVSDVNADEVVEVTLSYAFRAYLPIIKRMKYEILYLPLGDHRYRFLEYVLYVVPPLPQAEDALLPLNQNDFYEYYFDHLNF